MDWSAILDLAIVLACVLIGARVGGAGLGAVAGIGLAVLVFGFGATPGEPPVDVLFMIVAVVTAAATMQAAGGLDYLVRLAEQALKRSPRHITFVAPSIAYLFTLCSGTGHVVYPLLPVIAETARKAGIRPERPMSMAIIASQRAVTASPISAATVGMVGFLEGSGVTLADILFVCIPSTFLGCMIASFAMLRYGKELADDPEYRRRLDAGLVPPLMDTNHDMPAAEKRRARIAVLVFLTAAVLVVVLGVFPSLREIEVSVPAADGAQPETETMVVPMPAAIEIVMLSAAALMMLFVKASPEQAVKGSVSQAGAVAVVSILGIAWLGNCFFETHKEVLVGGIADTVRAYPWIFAVGMFVLSILLYSQAATVAALIPVGMTLGIPAMSLVAMFPATNGYFFFPTYGSIIAAISFDPTGTTRIGKYLLNHSFMLPGMIATIAAVAIGFGIVLVAY